MKPDVFERRSDTPVAVFVDGDNVSPSHADQILESARELGRPDIVRCYLNANQNSGWLEAPGYRVVHAGTGKNATDVLLAIEAMETALLRDVRAFVLATSDGDFTHLALRLREIGRVVLGLGEAKATQAFQRACARFSTLCKRAPSPENEPERTPLDDDICNMIASCSTNGSGMRLAELGPKMYAEHGIRISQCTEHNWRKYFERRPSRFTIDKKGPEVMVRCAPEGF